MSRDLTDDEKEKLEQTFKQFTEEKFDQDKADKVLINEDKIREKSRVGALAKFADDIGTLISMVKDYFSGEYKEIPLGTITAIIATLLYVFSPIDIILDFIPIIGLADDAAMVALCLKFISIDIKSYRQWKQS